MKYVAEIDDNTAASFFPSAGVFVVPSDIIEIILARMSSVVNVSALWRSRKDVTVL